uniref:Uncharacterized protein n=1 Tax=Zea mays TaxID=4577 RepID=C0PP29_MAIZE|nr:unknown [Zea mays]
MAETVGFASGDAAAWRAALAAYDRRLAALDKPDLVAVDSFYRHDLPALLRCRDPDPFLAKPELVRLLQWKLSRGKWRAWSGPCLDGKMFTSMLPIRLRLGFCCQTEADGFRQGLGRRRGGVGVAQGVRGFARPQKGHHRAYRAQGSRTRRCVRRARCVCT